MVAVGKSLVPYIQVPYNQEGRTFAGTPRFASLLPPISFAHLAHRFLLQSSRAAKLKAGAPLVLSKTVYCAVVVALQMVGLDLR